MAVGVRQQRGVALGELHQAEVIGEHAQALGGHVHADLVGDGLGIGTRGLGLGEADPLRDARHHQRGEDGHDGHRNDQLDEREGAAGSAGGAAEDGPGAAAETGTEESGEATTATDRSTIVPRPANWRSMTKTQRKNWHKKAKGKWR